MHTMSTLMQQFDFKTYKETKNVLRHVRKLTNQGQLLIKRDLS